MLCDVCGRGFRRESDKARHKCAADREEEASALAGGCCAVPKVYEVVL